MKINYFLGNTMPKVTYKVSGHFSCTLCNYQAITKSKQQFAMVVRLHKKKCKKTGRTVTADAKKQEDNKWKQLNRKCVSKTTTTTGSKHVSQLQ
tara:strand:+ start:38 stop:319 length:282 start_codon:yes stop_codon:yes gene_type:complete